MKSLIAIQNPGLGAYTVQPMPDDFQDTQAWYDMDYKRRQLAADREESQAFYNTPGTDATVAAANAAPAPAQTAADILEESRRFQFLARTRPGFDYGARSSERNALFARDSGLGFDLMNAITSSLKTNAPQAFKGVKGSEVFRSIVPNAGGPSFNTPKISLPSWLPKISLPRPLQDAARRAQNLAIATAKDVAAKKRAADAASGVAVQTSDYPAPQSSDNSIKWILGGAAILGAAFIATRKK